MVWIPVGTQIFSLSRARVMLIISSLSVYFTIKYQLFAEDEVNTVGIISKMYMTSFMRL